MTLQQSLRAVGTFASRREAEAALQQLRDSGFPIDRVSILAKDTDRNDDLGGVRVNERSPEEAREGAGVGAVTGTALGGVTGLLVGLEALIVPGVGPFLAAGTIATTLAGAGIGAAAGGLIGALADLGIPEEDARNYNDRLSQGDYLVTVEGSLDEIERAGLIFQKYEIRDWSVYGITNRGRTNNTDSDAYPSRTNVEI